MDKKESIKILKALADGSRLMIINSLFEKSQYVEEIAERFELAVSTVSHHLKKLEEAHLVEKKKEQYYVVYCIKEEIFNTSLKTIASFKNSDERTQEVRMANYRKKVLNTFFKGKKLDKIPTQHKKMLIVLDEILKRFTPMKEYTEKEVNDIIASFHEDHCRIRRELTDSGRMRRKNGIYRRMDKKIIQGSTPNKRKGKEKGRIMNRRKALKKEFVQKFTPPGVFMIKNNVNGKMFICGSLNVNAYIKRHKSELKFGSHRNKALLKDYNQFGDENFTFEVVESIKQDKDPLHDYKKDVAVLVDLWLEKLKPFGVKGYNRIPKSKK